MINSQEDLDYARSHSCAPSCAEHPFSSGTDWSAGIRAVTSDTWTPPGTAPEPLDPSLLPYLDWPLWLREDGLTCQRHDDGHACEDAPANVTMTGTYTTVREILTGIRAHAREKP